MIVKMLTHMHMMLFTWWCWHICKGEGVGVDVDQLVGKRNDGRTVCRYNSFLSREIAVLFGLEGRTADGPPLGCGQSAGVLKKLSREVVSLAWAERLDCGRSGPGARTVRRSLNKLTRDVLGLWWDLRVKGGWSAPGVRTVHRSVEKMTRDIFASGGLHDVIGGNLRACLNGD